MGSSLLFGFVAALVAAADEDSYLESSVACEAVAAAAVVASQRLGGAELVRTSYAPDFLKAAGGAIDLPSEFAGLAQRALDRVAGQQSEWRELPATRRSCCTSSA